jgi:signal transduction histidine kinase
VRVAESIFQDRLDRLISVGRALLALTSLLAAWADPGQPGHYAPALYVVLIAYSGYAAIIALACQWRGVIGERWTLGAHLLDLAVFTALQHLTQGPASPFFLLYIFSLFSASLKWGWVGTMWTMIAVTLLFVTPGLVFRPFADRPVELQRFLVRSAHLLVIGILLVIFGLHRERIGRQMLKLDAVPRDLEGGRLPIRAFLQYAAEVLGAPRALLVWTDPDEPWLYVVEWSERSFSEKHVGPTVYDPLVAPPVEGVAFLYDKDKPRVLLHAGDRRLPTWSGDPIHAGFLADHRIRCALSVPIASSVITGRLFVMDKPHFSPDDLTVGAALATRISVGFERFVALAAWREAASVEERLRLARDLHDGVLQFLAGTSLQLEAVTRAAREDPAETEARIRVLQDALVTEQRELRDFIKQLHPGSAREGDALFALEEDLAELAQRLETQWNVKIELAVEPPSAELPTRLRYDLHQMIREATANAVRHGRAKNILVALRCADGALALEIADDGQGLPETGTFDAPELIRRKLGPKSLRERVASLGGAFRIRSAASGTTVAASVPLARTGAER